MVSSVQRPCFFLFSLVVINFSSVGVFSFTTPSSFRKKINKKAAASPQTTCIYDSIQPNNNSDDLSHQHNNNMISSPRQKEILSIWKNQECEHLRRMLSKCVSVATAATTTTTTTLLLLLLWAVAVAPAWAATAATTSDGASAAANAKLTTGGASTLQSGRTISITRGVNLDQADFSNQNLKGVAFQQSIVRDANFRNSNLVGASFFDATVDGSDFENADMTLANVEMAQFNRANLKNTVLNEVYVSGATLFTGVKSIENSDWTDTYLRGDQRKYLCELPSAKGTNPTTGVATRESLMCK